MGPKSRRSLSIFFLVVIGAGSALGDSLFEGSQQEVDTKSFLSEICDKRFSLMSMMVKSFSVDHIDRNLEHLCKEGAHGLLLWVTAHNFDDISELDKGAKYIGRAPSDNNSTRYCTYDPRSETCYHKHGNLTTPILILGEKYPERYELRDMVYKKWTNSTRLGSPILAYATLKNRDPTYKYIDQDISYLSDSRIEYILPINPGLPLSIYRGKTELYKTISGETYYGRTFKTINAVRYMSPHTVINVTVIGTEEHAYREFKGKLVVIYTDEESYGWSRSLHSVDGASKETSLTETHVEYGVVVNMYEESHPPMLYAESDHAHPAQPVIAKSDNIHIHITETEMNQVYPEFRNIALGAAILFFSVLTIALLDIVRRIIRDRRAKRMRIGKYSKVNGR